MRFKHTLAVGVALALPALILAPLEANDGILKRLHHHADCDAKQSVVRLPAQEIRIETTQPRVIVNEGRASPRLRGYFPAGHGMVPMVHGNIVANFVPLNLHSGFSSGNTVSSSSAALRAMHELEIQAGEVNRLRAAQKAEMDHFEKVQQRIQASLAAGFQSAPSSDLAELKKSIDTLTKRVSDIERLLLIHDNILKEVAPTLKKQP